MRIALVSDCYLPRLGGIETQVRDLALSLKRCGHEAQVITATPVDSGVNGFSVAEEDGIVVHRMVMRLPGQLPVNPLAAPLLKQLLPTFDVVHIHSGVVSPFAQDAAGIAANMSVPTTMTWHCLLGELVPVLKAMPPFRNWVRKGICMNAVSAVAAQQVQTIIGGAGIVSVVPNGIDIESWASPARLGKIPGPVRLVSASRLVSRKRVLSLIWMMAVLRERLGATFTLTIYGEGPRRRACERLIEREGLEGIVTLAGRASREELCRAYAQADVFVLATELESFGISVLEARSAGLPVVVRADTGMEDFIAQGVNGYLAPSDDALVGALTHLVTHSFVRDKIRRHNTATKSHLTWENSVKANLAEYKRAQEVRPGWQSKTRISLP